MYATESLAIAHSKELDFSVVILYGKYTDKHRKNGAVRQQLLKGTKEGPYVFGTTVSSYLLSKEIYVLEHNYYNGISVAILCVMAVKKLGPSLSVYLDEQVDEETGQWNKYREDQFRFYNQAVELEKKAQLSAQAQTMLPDAKYQMVALQREAAFRERQMEVHREVVRRLDYMVEASRVNTNFILRHMASWVRDQVSKELEKDPELPRRVLSHCIAQLRSLIPQHEDRHEGTPAPDDDDGPEAANPGTDEEPAAAATVNMWGVPMLV
ncbi:ATP synthase subunit b, mitochondrial-like [Schistocerca piceifrons]|uniref:ATP synthase subunit b, mitochondrial-like n=1 Tax=Schistocerca piceifrons TaxID=274613 RepID=UPI001F5F72F4|nr:ATP synthase subunit b, mitochondrial-like [Schistocerca piceifrons]